MKLRTVLILLVAAALVAGAALLPRPSVTAQDSGRSDARERAQIRMEARIKALEARLGAMEEQLTLNTLLLEKLEQALGAEPEDAPQPR